MEKIFIPLALMWVLIAHVLPFLKDMNPFFHVIVCYLPLLATIKNKKIIYILPNYIFLLSGFIAYIITLQTGEANLVGIFKLMVLPAICINFVKCSKYECNYMYKIVAIAIYLINCFIVIVEYQLKINFLSYDLSYFERFRATGLWIHPLFNALIHAICILFIIVSDLNKYIKILLVTIGIYVIFMFDARTATIMLILSSCYILYTQGVIKFKNIIFLLLLVAGGYFFYEYLSSSELGGKLMNAEANKMDNSSTEARLITIKIFFDRSWEELFFGLTSKEPIFRKYGVKAIENSFVNMTLTYGIIPTILFYFLYIKEINNIMKQSLAKNKRYIILLSFIIVGITSTALTEPFVWISLIVFYKGFATYQDKSKMIKQRKLQKV